MVLRHVSILRDHPSSGSMPVPC